MRLKKITYLLIILAVASNIVFSNFLHQGFIGVGSAIVLLLIAATTTKDKNNQ